MKWNEMKRNKEAAVNYLGQTKFLFKLHTSALEFVVYLLFYKMIVMFDSGNEFDTFWEKKKKKKKKKKRSCSLIENLSVGFISNIFVNILCKVQYLLSIPMYKTGYYKCSISRKKCIFYYLDAPPVLITLDISKEITSVYALKEYKKIFSLTR